MDLYIAMEPCIMCAMALSFFHYILKIFLIDFLKINKI